jgi:2OG-Fe(II) oxygenase superfamily
MEELNAALDRIQASGTFTASGTILAPPTLMVGGLGKIELPLTPASAEELIAACDQAPYGRGEETLIDKNVRNVWQMDPSRFSVTGNHWQETMAALAVEIGKQLGLDDTLVECDLYKLLVYEEGSFFVAHRDTEKARNMFGTLVIVLPSMHEGGTLNVWHGDEVKSFGFEDGRRGKTTCYAAFYADCRHEVQKITSGYRLCLVYNLTVGCSQLEAANKVTTANELANEAIRVELGRWADRDDGPPKLAYLLDHHYTTENLCLDNLKNLDRKITNLLFDAAGENNCRAYLGILSLHETVSGNVPYDGRRSRSRWGRGRDEECEVDAADFEEYEVVESEFSATHLVDVDGYVVPIGDLPIELDEIIGRNQIDDIEPDEASVTEATGNEGATMERWYRRAAVILWPERRRYEVLATGDCRTNVGSLKAEVTIWKESPKSQDDAMRQDLRRFATAVIDNWQNYSGDYRSVRPATCNSELLDCLAVISDVEIIRAAFTSVLSTDVVGDEGPALARIFNKFGWETFSSEILELVRHRLDRGFFACATIIADLWEAADRPQDNQVILQEAATLVSNTFQKLHQRGLSHAMWGLTESSIPAMIKIECWGGDPILTAASIKSLFSNKSMFDICLVVERLIELRSWASKAASHFEILLQFCARARSDLNTSIAKPLVKPDNWQRDADLPCACDDCSLLKNFLRDTSREEIRILAATPRRQHIHSQIDQYHLDLTHETERNGRPFTLVCKKTLASYHAKMKRRRREKDHLTKLEESFPEVSLREIPHEHRSETTQA